MDGCLQMLDSSIPHLTPPPPSKSSNVPMDRALSSSSPPGVGLDKSVSSLVSSDSASTHGSSRPPSPSVSSVTSTSDLASGYKSLAASLELSNKLSSLVHQSNDFAESASRNDIAGENTPLPTQEDLAAGMQDLTKVVYLNNKALAVVGQLGKVQTEINERVFTLEHTVADVRAQSQCSSVYARRLLYRTREHVRKERDAMQKEGRLATFAQDELADEVRNLGAELARMRDENARILAILQSRISNAQRLQRLFRQVVWVYAPWFIESLVSAMGIIRDGIWRTVTFLTDMMVALAHGCLQAMRFGPYAGLIWGVVWFSIFLLISLYWGHSPSLDDRPVWQLARALP
ncbi:hypothetical protein GSI_01690 [Ganoderma sinense ZZ0214-1]|uniref:Uncharacterized protein n=1 Tax=Ganoderma sinense ZZ0214-1 TaxID=1077348 RepID=A0A2G8SQJ5_9APHY|nr:hypothetical protein GSI_01690 [Ganoderma sinense ZZ0214-1]